MRLNIFYRKKTREKHSIEKVYNTLLPYFSKFITVTITELPYISQGIFKRVFNIVFASLKQGDINHVTGDTHYINLLMRTNKTILTIHDIYPIIRTTGIKRFILKLFWFDLPIKKSKKIITISEFSKTELLNHFKISAKKIKVIYNCISPIYSQKEFQFNIEQPSILQIGTKENKNLENLLKATNKLNIKLLIVGPLTETQQSQLITYEIPYENFNDVSDVQLCELYKKCDLVSFVSTYEGFGLPIIEAQAVGRPVITSNISSMPEVAGEGALFVDPYSAKDIKRGILSLINDAKLRESIIDKGLSNVKRFQPDIIAKQYEQVYKEILTD